ncbi:dTDP-4-dehydrorhamnose 3,5-epimerase family protein [Lentilitoribacter sp. Alg239-R112]|uniref:dTDP-4-dehydrorhamnose 3,5-epimerase family protein n=1 Tax=Lentilitoribacter sp. Alg239-R112 TaxID=2305987 RepID=UPI0013A6F69F|nr:dTDP-4-dehydrorhamnose 3,5-epimerase family protein [Lentilitoribacter sp. Alg239-R112]
MGRFVAEDTSISGVKVITRTKVSDERGFLSRLFCKDELLEVQWHGEIAQINETMTHHKGTVRGLHFQREPSSEMKLVSCIHGRIFDVAVDLRVNSPTYLHYFSCELGEANNKALLIPRGCAHGFQTLTDRVRMIYCHSAAYDPRVEDGIHILDSRINIEWPLPPINLSQKDNDLTRIDSHFKGVIV